MYIFNQPEIPAASIHFNSIDKNLWPLQEAQKKAKQEEKRAQEAAVAAAKEREAAKATGGKKQIEKGKEKVEPSLKHPVHASLNIPS